ncbi:MAG TPA: cytochrome c, partial [Bacteroidia bacterium]|nr:cytochrome c [Bacteroidia bacterium]
MKKNILSCIFILFATLAFSQDGKELFQNNCKTCHTIGHGKLVGPDLKGVADRRQESF